MEVDKTEDSSGAVTRVENRGPLESGVIVTGTPVVIVVTRLPLKDDSTTCEIVVVYADATVVVMYSV